MSEANGAAGASGSMPEVPPHLRTEMRAIADVRRYWRNPRRKQNVEKVAQSIKRFGWRQPIVVDADSVIIVGDTRYLAAESMHLAHVPVWIAADLSPEQIHAYRIADNRIAEEAEWDEDALEAELRLLQELGFADVADLAEVTAFDEEELNRYLGGAEDAHTLEPVDVQEFPPYTWALIGVPTIRYHEIAEQIEAIQAVPDLFVELTVNDDKP